MFRVYGSAQGFRGWGREREFGWGCVQGPSVDLPIGICIHVKPAPLQRYVTETPLELWASLPLAMPPPPLFLLPTPASPTPTTSAHSSRAAGLLCCPRCARSRLTQGTWESQKHPESPPASAREWFVLGGGQHFQSLPESLPNHFRGRNEAWGQIPPPDWRAREVTGSDFWPKSLPRVRGEASLPLPPSSLPLTALFSSGVTLILPRFDARPACGRAGAPNTYLSLRNDAQQPHAQIGSGLSLPKTSQTPNPSLPSCFVTSRARQSGGRICPHASLRPRK